MMGDVVRRLTMLSSPAGERLADYERIDAFCIAAREAVAEMKMMREELTIYRGNHDDATHKQLERLRHDLRGHADANI